MVVVILIALWMKLQSLHAVVRLSLPSCSGLMLQAKKKVASRLVHLMSMLPLCRFSPSIWQRALNGMSSLFRALPKEHFRAPIALIQIIGLPTNAISLLPCAGMQIACQYFHGTQRQQMHKQRRQSIPLPICALHSRCAKKFALAMSQ